MITCVFQGKAVILVTILEVVTLDILKTGISFDQKFGLFGLSGLRFELLNFIEFFNMDTQRNQAHDNVRLGESSNICNHTRGFENRFII